MKTNTKLPTPSSLAIEHSQQLVKYIQESIKPSCTLGFSEYMQQALYAPNLGYYSNGLTKIGADGDFITAPETSSLFSRCLARQAHQVLSQLPEPNIVEFGAGRGIMARDILLELAELNQPIEHYYIIELSAELKHVQKQTLASLPDALKEKVIWLTQLPQNPISAVVLANEVIDAMPIEMIKLEPEQVSQAYVEFDSAGQANWLFKEIKTDNDELQNRIKEIQSLIGIPSPKGYQTEVNLNIQPWVSSIADFLTAGLVLIIDYGYSRTEYYQPAREMGTFRCHYQHLAHADPFFYPGLQDLTSHVDFTAVAEAGFKAGLDIDGFTTQAHFLMASGLLEMANEFEHDSPDAIKIAQQIKTLTMPNEMGESFKVIGMTKNITKPLIGFQMQNLLHTL